MYIHIYIYVYITSVRWATLLFLPIFNRSCAAQEGFPALQPSKFLAAGTHQEDWGVAKAVVKQLKIWFVSAMIPRWWDYHYHCYSLSLFLLLSCVGIMNSPWLFWSIVSGSEHYDNVCHGHHDSWHYSCYHHDTPPTRHSANQGRSYLEVLQLIWNPQWWAKKPYGIEPNVGDMWRKKLGKDPEFHWWLVSSTFETLYDNNIHSISFNMNMFYLGEALCSKKNLCMPCRNLSGPFQ